MLIVSKCAKYSSFLIMLKKGENKIPTGQRRRKARANTSSMTRNLASEDDLSPVFSCNYCDYKASVKSNVRMHERSIHEGIKYECDQCDYRATQTSNLKVHKNKRHSQQ